ncbi:MAG: hypothetical protein PWP28_1696 [Oceanotoga sp.]|jgi:predicted ribosome quality control (RQC) complex YloA/Tae2 family protein|uniref:Ribosome quality control (RQC) complex YloA/Tae2 family protein n=1 Tax=Oceanotoga teriensis TaxID=515440 RepID=A0AA45C4Y0_9BACT|nr:MULTISPECIES: NFACT family protein [Oceanotoga]MDN5342821.1 hypothetical protein [Oceanotoga sp.]PWJ87521.1 putative ribosome quality control (RQC) complex YloA/Tae2 family protein [Oceanotoga teriensis]
MPLDGLVFHKLINEIKENCLGSSIRNIYQPINSEVLIQLRNNNILFSLNNPAYIMLLKDKPEVPENPVNFSQYLRKSIKGFKIKNIVQLSMDRTGYIELEGFNLIGDLKKYRLYFELMGRNSNLILVNSENKIEDALKKYNENLRTILPGAKFVPFFDDSKKNFLLDHSNIDDLFVGFSKKSYKFLKYNGLDKTLKSLGNNKLYFFKEDNKYDVSAIKPIKEDFELLDPSVAILKLFEFSSNQSRIIHLKKDLEKIIIKEIDKNENLKYKLLNDISEEKNIEDLINKGELLQTYIFKAKRGDSYIDVSDWNNGKTFRIELDPLKNPSTNLENYFKKIKKIKTRVIISKKRLRKTENILDYLYQLLLTIEESEDIDNLSDIREEMFEEGLLKKDKKLKRKNNKISFKTFKFKDFDIFIGKNNKQNDELTRNASKEDIWLHTHNIPGSHAIIKSAGKIVPDDVIEYAASLEASFSKAKMSYNVPVDFTTRDNVWKPKGSKPGMWLYKNYKTIIVNPKKSDT